MTAHGLLASALRPPTSDLRPPILTLLAERTRLRAAERLRLYDSTRSRLREALHDLAPGHVFHLFGSLIRRGTFNAASDVDLAFTTLPDGKTEYQLAAELSECLGCSVDMVDLQHTRLRAKIESGGERWIG